MTDVSQRLLAHHGGLRGLFRLNVAELARVRGLSRAKAVRLEAALGLGRRLAARSTRQPVRGPWADGAPVARRSVEAQYEQAGVKLYEPIRRGYEQAITRARAALSADRFGGLWNAERAMILAEAVDAVAIIRIGPSLQGSSVESSGEPALRDESPGN